jgi:hypothetical protein
MTLEERVAVLEKRISNLQTAMMEVIDALDVDYDTTCIYDALTCDCKPKDNTVYSAGMSSDDIDALIANA